MKERRRLNDERTSRDTYCIKSSSVPDAEMCKFNYRQATSVSSVFSGACVSDIMVLFLLISHPSIPPRVGPVTWSIYTAAAAFVFTITGQTALVQGACAVTFLHQWGRQRAGAEKGC